MTEQTNILQPGKEVMEQNEDRSQKNHKQHWEDE